MARSTSGTICMDEVCKLMEMGARCGLRSLKLKKFGIEMEYQDNKALLSEYSAPVAFTTESVRVEESSGNSTEGPYDKEVLDRMARELKEERLATLALEDPLEYEEILANPDRYLALFGNEG